MALLNENYLKLPEEYFFSEIEKKVNVFKLTHPKANIISLGIGDVTLPLPEEVAKAMQKAIKEMTTEEGFHGYGPVQGYQFLIEKIIKYDYASRGISLQPDEVFVSDGAKSDIANIGHILGKDNIIAITEPVYPVYENTAIMSGRAGKIDGGHQWKNIVYINCSEENNFIPEIPTEKADVIYLCYPNNPTGTALNKTELKKWIDYALENNAIIIYDGAYEAFITEKDIPHSIYEIKGAKKVAIEIRSYSKSAGFTGLRCAYTIVPNELIAFTEDGSKMMLNKLWRRRQSTCFNGVAYIVQRGAEATYTNKGRKQTKALIDYYLRNVSVIREELLKLGFKVFGGINSPYLWIKIPNNIPSWQFFEQLLHQVHIIGTPGIGFGSCGEGYFRFAGFSKYEQTLEAMERIKKWAKPL